MTSYEKAEIQRLPRKYRPLSAWGYLFLSILYAIPVIGWICLVVHAFSDKNIVRRSFAKCYFWVFVITVVGIAVAAIVDPTLVDKVKGIFAK
jgi:purine-cytosine permease-like protein